MTYELPDLPYEYDALEPHIDSRIMELHHDKHHQGYVDGANAALKKLSEMRESEDFGDIKPTKRALAFHLSGHVNHTIFWENMSPDGGGEPESALADRIEQDFGSYEGFKSEFSAAAGGVEGSGWALLLHDAAADQLIVGATENHQNQTPQATTPILALDVWEHAYYLQYENNRGEYVDAFWNVVDWDDVAQRFEQCQGKTIQ